MKDRNVNQTLLVRLTKSAFVIRPAIFPRRNTGIAKMQLREDAEAVSWFLRSIEANRNYPLAHFLPPMHSRYSARWIRRGPLPIQDLRSIQALPSAASVTADRVTIQP